MEIFDNITKIVKDDLTVTIKRGSRLSIAAACFSIYAYQVMKKQFDQIDELRFIFTSPAIHPAVRKCLERQNKITGRNRRGHREHHRRL